MIAVHPYGIVLDLYMHRLMMYVVWSCYKILAFGGEHDILVAGDAALPRSRHTGICALHAERGGQITNFLPTDYAHVVNTFSNGGHYSVAFNFFGVWRPLFATLLEWTVDHAT